MRPNELHATTCRELFREWLCSILVFKASPGDGARASVITSLSKPSAYVHGSSCIAGTSSGTLVVAQGCNSCSILLLPTKISNSKGKAISCSIGRNTGGSFRNRASDDVEVVRKRCERGIKIDFHGDKGDTSERVSVAR